jgi:crooked neck
MPEMIWKQYIDLEMEEGESDKARALYERLLDRTRHVKVWVSYAQFEASSLGLGMKAARDIFERGYNHLKDEGLKEERILLLDAWRLLEKAKGDHSSVAAVEAKMPRRIKRKRLRKDDVSGEGWEEYFDYCFPDEQGAAGTNLKILEMAAKWKQQQQQQLDDSDDDDE